MGLNFFKNRQNEQKDETDHAPVVTPPEFDSEEAKKQNRFTMLVEAIAQIPDHSGIAIKGVVHGRCHVDDKVVMLHPGRIINQVTIDRIELNGQRADYAEDEEAVIRINALKDAKKVLPFSVLTSILPQAKIDVNTAIENPYLLGLAQDFRKFHSNQNYMNLLVFELVHSNYITPLRIMGEQEETEDGKVKFKKGAQIGFLSVKDPQEEGKFVFPLFTDWKELREWKGVFDDNHPPKTMIFTFPSVLSMLKENHTGLLINGFGKSPLVIPMAMIEKITSLDAYQREFVKKEPMPSGDESAAHSKQ